MIKKATIPPRIQVVVVVNRRPQTGQRSAPVLITPPQSGHFRIAISTGHDDMPIGITQRTRFA